MKKSKIVVLDEATANVDHEYTILFPNKNNYFYFENLNIFFLHSTDALIQSALRSRFSSATVLCVAHRLRTVADADAIAVMEGGRVQVSRFDEKE